MKDEDYLRRCIELAQIAVGNTYPNPLVGSVIVHNGKIIGEGFHERAGEPHAEINAIRSVRDKGLLPESTLYVSLEPCSHFGRTPPCAEAIKEMGFKRVVIGAMDINERVNGRGKALLEAAGIEVCSPLLEAECWELNKRFFTYHSKRRPYITLKWASSADGFLDKDYQPFSISNGLSKQWVHRMRSAEQAILVGTQTALGDNPSLTTREVVGRSPIRLLIDLDLKVPRDFNIFNDEAETMVFNSQKEGREDNVLYVRIQNKERLLEEMIEALYQLQIQSVLVEGGGFTLGELISRNLWDEAVVISNPSLHLANGTKAPDFNFVPYKEEQLRDNLIRFYRNHHS
ncbi:MAG: bifunctional diaminohydroxyphosphoribosylaminopyrimidine deaminase/5-amino-6-(5-phosphoribosylamino)uracil reductase RibD [Bergeyella cardium]